MNSRGTEKENLDNLDLNGPELFQSLDSLAWINKWLGNYQYITKAILQTVKNNNLSQVHLIDIGCGGGDLLRYLAKKFEDRGISYKFVGIDGNQNSVNFAARKSYKYPNIRFQKADILKDDFEIEQCDLLISNALSD